jgi:hypothetical protein
MELKAATSSGPRTFPFMVGIFFWFDGLDLGDVDSSEPNQALKYSHFPLSELKPSPVSAKSADISSLSSIICPYKHRESFNCVV